MYVYAVSLNGNFSYYFIVRGCKLQSSIIKKVPVLHLPVKYNARLQNINEDKCFVKATWHQFVTACRKCQIAVLIPAFSGSQLHLFNKLSKQKEENKRTQENKALMCEVDGELNLIVKITDAESRPASYSWFLNSTKKYFSECLI